MGPDNIQNGGINKTFILLQLNEKSKVQKETIQLIN